MILKDALNKYGTKNIQYELGSIILLGESIFNEECQIIINDNDKYFYGLGGNLLCFCN